jgi:hypothetical protein
MRRVLALPALIAAVAVGAWIGSSSVASGSTTASEAIFTVRVGDRIDVAGAQLACKVVRVPELGRRIAVDCRRGGPLPGTYGTLITARDAAVVKFESTRVAKLLFVARHEGEARKCGST